MTERRKNNSELKPSIKSVEGGGFIGMVAGCIGLLYTIFFVDKGGGAPDLTVLLEMATSSTEISEAYKSQVNWIREAIGLGETSALLVFLYKLFTSFSGDRSALKKAALMEERK